ncbi:MAG: hypothetical protein HQK71_04050 [Desulfamplus sp.]|nr:hypothetical protein [Desulfamplus sp.]
MAPKEAKARIKINRLLEEAGWSFFDTDNGKIRAEETFIHRDFERKFFSDNTNQAFCRSFLENALRDPISGEIGKTIIFCVSQNHAAKITQILNEIADAMFPNRYNSNFAMQVTSRVDEAQQFTSNFTHNKLSGTGNFNPSYKTSKTRVCVTDIIKIDRMYFDRFERTIIDHPTLKKQAEEGLPPELRKAIPEYIKDFVPFNKFAA